MGTADTQETRGAECTYMKDFMRAESGAVARLQQLLLVDTDVRSKILSSVFL